MIHVEQKNILKKNGVQNLAKSTNEISIGIKASTDASKKTSDVNDNDSLSKNKANNVFAGFIMILYGFLWILEKIKQKEGNFIV